jgi:hypothetical protein
LDKFRISICKQNGSVWMEEYEDIQSVSDALKELLLKHPHLLVSRQRVIKDDKES